MVVLTKKNISVTLTGIAGCLVIAGCCTVPAAAETLRDAGHITPEQAAEILSKVGSDKWGWLADAGMILGSAVLAWLGIRLPPGMIPGVSRGKATQTLMKNGELPTPPAQ